MRERWAKPAEILDIDEEPTMVMEGTDGRRWGVPRITVSEETKERIRLGYMCMVCFQPFERAWPELCGFCGVRVRDGQGEYFQRMHQVERFRQLDEPEDYDIYELLAREMKNGGSHEA